MKTTDLERSQSAAFQAPATDDTARMMEIAISQGEAGVAALERLVAMRERAEDRAAARSYSEAIGRFQAECPIVGKDATGAHGARYATLAQIMEEVRPALRDSGLSVTFDSEDLSDGRLRVLAIVHHSDGHSDKASFTVTRERASNRMNATQADGSALSYAKRYALCLALGIGTGETDDDGRGAGVDPTPISAAQAADVRALIEEVGAHEGRFLSYLGVDDIGAIPAARFAKAVAALEAKRRVAT